MEIKTPCDIYMVDFVCDMCNDGYMAYVGQNAPSIDPKRIKYAHKCTKCGAMQMYDKVYPHQELVTTRGKTGESND